MNDLCYENSQDGICLNSFDCVLLLKYTHKTEIKDGLQHTNKKLSLPGDTIIYTPDLIIN